MPRRYTYKAEPAHPGPDLQRMSPHLERTSFERIQNLVLAALASAFEDGGEEDVDFLVGDGARWARFLMVAGLGMEPETALKIQLAYCARCGEVDAGRFRPTTMSMPRKLARPFEDCRADGPPAWWQSWPTTSPLGRA